MIEMIEMTLTSKFSQRRHWAAEQAISYLMQQAVENPGVISLAAGLVDAASLPVETTRNAVMHLLGDDARARQALQYGTTAGSERLRQLLVDHLARLEHTSPEKLGIGPEQMVLTTGSQQFLSLVADVLLDPGDICLVAAPTYFVFLGVLNGLGARAVPVASDDEGMRTDDLESQLKKLEKAGELDRVKLIYVVSYYENPSGVSLSERRRLPLLDIARRWSKSHRLFVLEDAAYRELRYDGPDVHSLWADDRSRDSVILAGTFSKSFSPGVRVGFGIAPTELLRPILDRKGNEDFGSANLNQHLMATVLEQGLYEPHVRQVCDAYRRKRDAMLAAADRYFGDLPGVHWVRPRGGLYVWMTLPHGVETGFDSRLFRHATGTEKVMYVPGELCYAGPPSVRPGNRMRLSFGVEEPARIDEGMKRLSAAIRAVL